MLHDLSARNSCLFYSQAPLHINTPEGVCMCVFVGKAVGGFVELLSNNGFITLLLPLLVSALMPTFLCPLPPVSQNLISAERSDFIGHARSLVH